MIRPPPTAAAGEFFISSQAEEVQVCAALLSLFTDPQTRAFLRDESYFVRVSHLLEQIARGEDPIFYGAPAVVLVHSPQLIPTPREDSVLSAYNLVLAAEAMDLGSCFVSLGQNAINSSAACKRILGLQPSVCLFTASRSRF